MKNLSVVLLILSLVGFQSAMSAKGVDTQVNLPAPSSRAQTLYTAARDDLLQIRVLLKNGRTQTSVGSGFLIGTSNLVVTNYHVVSQIVMSPESYTGQFIDTHGIIGNVKLVAVDALHDLAVVSVSRQGKGYFQVPDTLPNLTQGQYLYSLGNPLDLGFAISEGSYNGLIKRGFYGQLMFTGAINAGMSGGPNITEDGRVAGVNVSKRLDGELVSFLVPVEYVRNLLKVASSGSNLDFKKTVGQQLLSHQNALIDTVLGEPFSLKALGNYLVPVRESEQMRCWGRSNDNKDSSYDFNAVDCSMESAIYVSDQLQVGHISIRHEYLKATQLDSLRFSALISQAFKNENFGNNKDKNLTAPMCKEAFVANSSVPLRAVLCVRAYREFDGLYDFSLLTASTDDRLSNLQSRLDASGVSYDNGLRISHAFLNQIALISKSVPASEQVKP